MKFAGHKNPRTFGKSYAHPVCEVDGPATYLGIASRHGHIQNRRGMGMYRNVQLWQSLPAKAEFEFQERSDILALDEIMDNLSLKLSKASSAQEKDQIRLDQHRAYNEKKRLYLEELKRLRKSQPNKLKSATTRTVSTRSLFFTTGGE